MTKKKSAVAKVQHYVPKFLLKNFANGKKHQLHVFDKRTEATFVANVQKVASESRFYDFEFEGQKLTLESGLSKLESAAKPLVEQLIQTDSIASLTDEDRATLSAFFAVQFTRTRAFREQWRSIGDLIASQMREWAGEDDRTSVEEYLGVRNENRDKMELARIISTAPQTYSKHFFEKDWVLLKTEQKRPFIIGDNPLTLQNSIDMGPRGNIGLAVIGIEIYFPLSPVRALAMWCPSHLEMLRKEVQRLRSSPTFPLTVAADIVRAMETGCPLSAEPDNVVNFNSLQVILGGQLKTGNLWTGQNRQFRRAGRDQ